ARPEVSPVRKRWENVGFGKPSAGDAAHQRAPPESAPEARPEVSPVRKRWENVGFGNRALEARHIGRRRQNQRRRRDPKLAQCISAGKTLALETERWRRGTSAGAARISAGGAIRS